MVASQIFVSRKAAKKRKAAKRAHDRLAKANSRQPQSVKQKVIELGESHSEF